MTDFVTFLQSDVSAIVSYVSIRKEHNLQNQHMPTFVHNNHKANMANTVYAITSATYICSRDITNDQPKL